MERLALIGVSHRRGGADALADWHERYADPDALASLGLPHAVVLATCNRWEAALHLPEGVSADEARRRMADGASGRGPYAYVRDGALERLIRVAAGLDSLNPGEDQIMRQVRIAYLGARDTGRTDPVLHFAFERALRAAKRVRREIALAPVRTSLFSLARPELERRLPPGSTVLVVSAVVDPTAPGHGVCSMPDVRCDVEGEEEVAGRATRRMAIEQPGLGPATVWVDLATGLAIASEGGGDPPVRSELVRLDEGAPDPGRLAP